MTIRRRLLRQLGLLVPGFHEIREHRPLAAPLVLITVFSVVGAFSVQPLLAVAAAGETAGGLSILVWLAAIFSPVLIGAKGLVLAVLAWSALILLGKKEVRFRLLASIFLYGEAILALHGVAMVSVLHLRGTGAVTDLEDLYVPMGLEGLVPPDSPVLLAMAQGATVFHLAWFLFVATALVRAADLPRRAAWMVAGGVWAFALSMAALRALAFA